MLKGNRVTLRAIERDDIKRLHELYQNVELGILADGNNGFYYQPFDAAIKSEGDLMQVIDVLAREVGVLGIFSDWPATTTFYANCAGLR